MCVACVAERVEARPAAGHRVGATLSEEERRELYELELLNGILVRCRRCRSVYRPSEDGAVTRRGLCLSCEGRWIEEEVLIPLVEALGRRGARRALRGLVKECAKWNGEGPGERELPAGPDLTLPRLRTRPNPRVQNKEQDQMNTLHENGPVAQITIAPMVRCVDIHGDPVPECQRDIPEVTPDPTDPADWPAWTDNWHWETEELEREDLEFSAAFDAAMEAFEARHPLPEPADIRDPHEWPASLMESLPPISGGAPDDGPGFEPTAEDLADFGRWSEELDAWRNTVDESRAWYAANPIASFNALRTD